MAAVPSPHAVAHRRPCPRSGSLQPFPLPAHGVTKTYQFSSVSKLSRGSCGLMKGRLSSAIWFVSGCFSTEGEGLRQVPGTFADLAACGSQAGGTWQAGSNVKGVPGSWLFPLGSSGDQRTRASPRLCARVLGEDATRGLMFTHAPRASAAALHLLAAGRRSASAPSWLSCCPINPLPHSSQSTLHPWWAPCSLPAAGRGLWGLLGAAGSALKRQPAPGLSNSGD